RGSFDAVTGVTRICLAPRHLKCREKCAARTAVAGRRRQAADGVSVHRLAVAVEDEIAANFPLPPSVGAQHAAAAPQRVLGPAALDDNGRAAYVSGRVARVAGNRFDADDW